MNTQFILQSIQPQRDALLQHPLYEQIKTVADLQQFLEVHVYAVWDFMSLLKASQNKLTCTNTPWFASENRNIRHLINQIVLAEESDIDINGQPASHFEMYLEAMEACGAKTTDVTHFLESVQTMQNVFASIRISDLHPQIKAFLDFTFKVIEQGKIHEIAAAFTFGREDLIQDMFTEILNNFKTRFPDTDLSKLIYYFERHVALDADEHGPMAMQMIEALCENDEQKWKEVEAIAKTALNKRIGIWDAIAALLEEKQLATV